MASVNDIIGNYRLIKELASGSFGRVYRGEHAILTNRIVAIKLLHSTHLNSHQERESFIREAKLLEQLKHSHILPIIDVGLHNGFPYLVTEYAPNGSLRDRLQRQPAQPSPTEEILTILSQIGKALLHAHQQNIIHRDLKPENILFNTKGDALLADFGIATVYSTLSLQQATIIGTPAYMAPEQFRGFLCKESDQYALGCIAYELFTGRKPFTAPDFASLMFKHLMENPVSPRQLNPRLPAHIEQAILKAIAKERTERYADVAAFTTALRRTKKQWLDEGNAHYRAKHYQDALTAYDHAIQLDSTFAIAYFNKGNTLFSLKRYKDALAAYDCAIRLNPNYALALRNKGITLFDLQHYQEVLAAFERAIQCDPNDAYAYYSKGITLSNLKRYQESLAAFNYAIQLDPNNAQTFNGKGAALRNLKCYTEALTTFEHAIQLDPNDADFHYNKTLVLELLVISKEAQQAYKKAKQLGYRE